MSENETPELTVQQAIQVALSVKCSDKTMYECEELALDFISHLANIGFIVTPSDHVAALEARVRELETDKQLSSGWDVAVEGYFENECKQLRAKLSAAENALKKIKDDATINHDMLPPTQVMGNLLGFIEDAATEAIAAYRSEGEGV